MSESDASTPPAADIELVSPDDLIAYENNPKQHPEWQIDKIASSIKNHGFDQPIVVDGDSEIIKGHGRQRAAKKLGLDRVPIVRRDDLSDAQAKAARIADNKTQMETGWNMDNLALEVEQLEETEVDVDVETGFDEQELDTLLEEQDVDIDQFFEEEPPDAADDSTDDPHDPSDEVSCPDCGHVFIPADTNPD